MDEHKVAGARTLAPHDPEHLRPLFDLRRSITVLEDGHIGGGCHSHLLAMSILGGRRVQCGGAAHSHSVGHHDLDDAPPDRWHPRVSGTPGRRFCHRERYLQAFRLWHRWCPRAVGHRKAPQRQRPSTRDPRAHFLIDPKDIGKDLLDLSRRHAKYNRVVPTGASPLGAGFQGSGTLLGWCGR